MSKYLLKPKTGTFKEGFYLEDDANSIVYEGQMTKFKLFGASPYDFVNHITNKTETHNIGKTVTIEQNTSSGLIDALSTKSYFKYEGVKIWDYLHDKGIRIESHLSDNKIGMTHIVSLNGNEIAVISTSSPKGKSFITSNRFYDIECEEKDLDIVFLVAFSIAKTEQLTYN